MKNKRFERTIALREFMQVNLKRKVVKEDYRRINDGLRNCYEQDTRYQMLDTRSRILNGVADTLKIRSFIIILQC